MLSHILALALSIAASEAAYKGFNYGSTNPDGSYKAQSDFESEFTTAKNLIGTSGFTSARLYTMIQGGSSNTPISAIPAAIAEDTSLLLGLWASGGNMANELAALKSAISQYGDDFAKLVVGISVGSEDLYRDSETGIQADAGVGVGPDEIVSYIQQVRSAISGTSLSSVPIGHVDTWNAWTNSSNSAVIDACDWLGFDGYPYFQSTMANSIDDAKSLFDASIEKTKAVANGKEIWVTETGWPVSGSTQNLGVASIANAKQFWDQVGCPLFDNTNTWWYILQDASGSVTPSPSFGIVGNTLSTTPLFDLSCSVSSSSSAVVGSTSTASASKTTGFVTSSATGSAATTSGAGSSSSHGSGSGSGAGSGAGAGSSFGFGSSSVIPSSSVPYTRPSSTLSVGRPGASSSASAGSSSSSSSSSNSNSGSGSSSGSSTTTKSGTGSATSPASSSFTGAADRVTGSLFAAGLLAVGAVIAL
ncbi:glucan endo-1,3-beta-glucosidase eglC [Aspergillus rambellii]|uniref:Probable glucan endo-1,3-beta-glucosidase eglC n=1 Tax=Aspergillus rambellii TaxID=308745 RepID=A0A0F8ULX0_9EURO|nr:glucan endo-1,3-beta-glucosidase eglC [Aspergillus rambellii]